MSALCALGLAVASESIAHATETEAAGDDTVLPELTRSERASPRDDDALLGARAPRRERKRPRREAVDDDDWLVSTGTNRFGERFYDLGVFTGMGGPVAAPGLDGAVGLTGLRVMENHGYLSKFLVFALMAMGMRDSAYVGSSYSTDAYGNQWRTDYYRSLTPEERATQEAALSSAVNAEYVMELNVYTRGLWGFAPGLRQAGGFEFYLGGETVVAQGRVPTVLQIAGTFSWLGVRGASFKANEGPHAADNPGATHAEDYDYWNVGVMLRALIPVNEWIEATVQWDLNVLSFWDMTGSRFKKGETSNLLTSPLRAGVLVNLTDRAYLKGHGSVNVLGGFGLGYGAELGVRF